MKRAVVLLISGAKEEFAPGRPINFSLRITGPPEDLVASHGGSIPTAPAPPWDLPAAINIATEVAFQVKEYGRYIVTVTAQPASHPKLDASVNFYAVQSSEIISGLNLSASSDMRLIPTSEDRPG